MLMGNCSDEKMVVISSTTKEWPQINNQMISPDDPKACLNNNMHQPAPSNARIMEKPGQQQIQQQQQQALKCPRCDSSNTKFCYYNNYSLSQPRHFCKACKRYWTRGGTLRNVPVGGGCRKNKRVKRPNSSSSPSSSPSSSLLLPHHHHHDLHHNNSSTSSSSSPSPSSLLPPQIDNHHIMSPLFYGSDNNNVPSNNNNNNNNNNSHDITMSQLPFSRLMSSTTSGYHGLLHSHLGFSSGNINNNTTILSGINTTTDYYNNCQINGFSDSNSSSLLSSYSSIFSTPSLSSPSPAITSLLASKFTTNGGLKDHVLSRGSSVHFPSLSSPFEELQITANNGESGMGLVKQVKLEDGQRKTLDWNGSAHNCTTHENDDHQTVGEQSHVGLSSPSDPNSLNYWSINPTAVGGANWHDPGNIGSSVPSLI